MTPTFSLSANHYHEQNACVNCKYCLISYSHDCYCCLDSNKELSSELLNTRFNDDSKEWKANHFVAKHGICNQWTEQ